jgi:hypothetical protein
MSRLIKRTTAVVALIAAMVAISAPIASARFDLNPPPASSNSNATTFAPANPVSVQSSAADSSGFQWGDAAIGAAVTLAVISMAAGTVLLVRHSRERGAPAIS